MRPTTMLVFYKYLSQGEGVYIDFALSWRGLDRLFPIINFVSSNYSNRIWLFRFYQILPTKYICFLITLNNYVFLYRFIIQRRIVKIKEHVRLFLIILCLFEDFSSIYLISLEEVFYTCHLLERQRGIFSIRLPIIRSNVKERNPTFNRLKKHVLWSCSL